MTKAMFVKADDGERLSVLGAEMTVKATSAQTGGAYEVVVAESGPGGDVMPHRHPWEESYFILQGEMEIHVGARTHLAGPGDFVTIPAKALHSFRVVSDGARFLHVSIGTGAIDAFTDLDAAVPGAPQLEDFEALFEITTRHGIDVALPEGV